MKNPFCQGDGECPGVCVYCLEYANQALLDYIEKQKQVNSPEAEPPDS